MTADEVKAAKARLGMSYEQMGRRLSVTPRTVMRWARLGVGGSSSLLLQMLVKHEGSKNV